MIKDEPERGISRGRQFFLLPLAFILSSCAAPTVNLATSEPIKVDINMRLDVYQYGQTGGQKTEAKPAAGQTPKIRRDNRMADIQIFKNSQLVGESRDGLLVIQEKAQAEKSDYREFIRVTVEAENADRTEDMKALADSQKTSLPEIQAKQAELWRNRSFKGEMIETPQPDGGWKWVPKEG